MSVIIILANVILQDPTLSHPFFEQNLYHCRICSFKYIDGIAYKIRCVMIYSISIDLINMMRSWDLDRCIDKRGL